MFAGLKIYDDHLSVFQSKQLLRLKYYTISERKWRGGQTLSNFYFVIQFIIFFGNIWVSDTCCWFMNIVAQMMIELTGRGTMMKLLRLAVRRLFCLKRIEMEKNGFLYFSSFHKKKTIDLTNISLSVPKVCIWKLCRQILSNLLLFTGCTSTFIKDKVEYDLNCFRCLEQISVLDFKGLGKYCPNFCNFLKRPNISKKKN